AGPGPGCPCCGGRPPGCQAGSPPPRSCCWRSSGCSSPSAALGPAFPDGLQASIVPCPYLLDVGVMGGPRRCPQCLPRRMLPLPLLGRLVINGARWCEETTAAVDHQ